MKREKSLEFFLLHHANAHAEIQTRRQKKRIHTYPCSCSVRIALSLPCICIFRSLAYSSFLLASSEAPVDTIIAGAGLCEFETLEPESYLWSSISNSPLRPSFLPVLVCRSGPGLCETLGQVSCLTILFADLFCTKSTQIAGFKRLPITKKYFQMYVRNRTHREVPWPLIKVHESPVTCLTEAHGLRMARLALDHRFAKTSITAAVAVINKESFRTDKYSHHVTIGPSCKQLSAKIGQLAHARKAQNRNSTSMFLLNVSQRQNDPQQASFCPGMQRSGS